MSNTIMRRKCVHCGVPGEYPLDRCDTCAGAWHNHNYDMCMACHQDEAAWLGALAIAPGSRLLRDAS